MMYTADDSDLNSSGGTKTISLDEAKARIAAKRKAKVAAESAGKFSEGSNGTPLGRAFNKFLK